MALDSREASAALRLADLPFMTHSRLRRLVALGRPADVVRMLQGGTETLAERSWHALLNECPRGSDTSLGVVWGRHLRDSGDTDPRRLDGVDVLFIGDHDYPSVLENDPAAPAILFVRGDVDALDAPRVGIIGTRNSTAHGRATAADFARELSASGVAVVSGLARGIDAAAHRGALDVRDGARGRPVAVVASGPDVVYPRENASLWRGVIENGILLSESPPGTPPEAFRFPLRNRITAALCDVLLVVESRLDGGSMITVREALDRGVTVMAVPGSTNTRSAQGTNLLIRDGASVALEPADVLAVLGLDTARRVATFERRRVPDDGDARVLSLFGDEPLSLSDVATRAANECALPFDAVALSLGRLEAMGWIGSTAGWFERLAVPH